MKYVDFIGTVVTLMVIAYFISDTDQEATISFALMLAGAALMRATIADYKHEAKP